MLLFLVALGAVTDATLCLDDDCVQEHGTFFLQRKFEKIPSAKLSQDESMYDEFWYPGRDVDNNRSGSSAALGPFPLRQPAWQFEIPDDEVTHQTPSIDHMHNVYITGNAGILRSFDREGNKRWEVQAVPKNRIKGTSCAAPTLMEDLLYMSCCNGEVIAYSTDVGQEIWRKKIADELPSDSYSVGAFGNYLLVPAGHSVPYGSQVVALLDRANGALRWKAELEEAAVNMMACHFNESVVLSDRMGGIYRLALADGSRLWYQPGLGTVPTLGGIACAPNSMVYIGYITSDKPKAKAGGLRALDIATGKQVWQKDMPDMVHNAPAVGKLYGLGSKLAVVFGLGQPSGLPFPLPANIDGKVLAADAETGEILWEFAPPTWKKSGCAGSTVTRVCLPDLWSGATIGGDGTVYINWSAGGVTYALRDANGDGTCSLDDANEVGSYDLQSAATGPPAIVSQMLVVATCNRLAVFS